MTDDRRDPDPARPGRADGGGRVRGPGSGTASAASPPMPTDGGTEPGDAGVLERLIRRPLQLVPLPAVLLLLTAVTAWGWPAWGTDGAGLVIAVLTAAVFVAAVMVMVGRARRWMRVRPVAASWAGTAGGGAPGDDRTGWVAAVCGPPTSLHAGSGRIPMVRPHRRFPAVVLPLRTVEGPLVAGVGVVVHGRRDLAVPAAGDDIRVHVSHPRGPFLIARRSDGAIFAADRWIIG